MSDQDDSESSVGSLDRVSPDRVSPDRVSPEIPITKKSARVKIPSARLKESVVEKILSVCDPNSEFVL